MVSSFSPTSDQTAYIRHVEEQIGRKGFHIDEDDSPLFSTLSVENALPSLNPLLFSEAKHRRVETLMEQAGARVLLSGAGGDEITCAQQDGLIALALPISLQCKFQFTLRADAGETQDVSGCHANLPIKRRSPCCGAHCYDSISCFSLNV